MGVSRNHTAMKVFVALATLVTLSSARPRFLVIPLEDVDFGATQMQFPVYRMPALARQARQVADEQDGLAAPRSYSPYANIERSDSEPSGSNAYAAPAAAASPDHVDYGAYTGNNGAFGWYTDHPVALTGH